MLAALDTPAVQHVAVCVDVLDAVRIDAGRRPYDDPMIPFMPAGSRLNPFWSGFSAALAATAEEPIRTSRCDGLLSMIVPKPFVVGRTDVTFAGWDLCVAAGACPKVSDNGWGRGDRPVMLVSWEEAKGYAAWLKRMAGKDYRLLSEAPSPVGGEPFSIGRVGGMN